MRDRLIWACLRTDRSGQERGFPALSEGAGVSRCGRIVILRARSFLQAAFPGLPEASLPRGDFPVRGGGPAECAYGGGLHAGSLGKRLSGRRRPETGCSAGTLHSFMRRISGIANDGKRPDFPSRSLPEGRGAGWSRIRIMAHRAVGRRRSGCKKGLGTLKYIIASAGPYRPLGKW